ncbi:calmodulin-binding receptor-like cytoplasmic kinase 2 isoform X2 [Impatiens glandulifera]|uniref:calmodulin-binding receptor-like cytoplasmic kinase 2 isoform X2 n=1 Tax=Impatiens glandulifera TaxID=253017 RepID=UPI001FB0E160|nr:calmodulin-binding receptor-like cytoplasmic kinase 2 isoform X2 [Impatiens glandulifera]
MSSWSSPYSSRTSRSGGLRTPERLPNYSSPSPFLQKSTSRRRNTVVKDAFTTFTGAFTKCFTPTSEPKTFKDLGDSDEFKAISDGSSRGGNMAGRRPSRRSFQTTGSNEQIMCTVEPGSVKFSLNEILKATKNFSSSLKIGQGGFGTVYKGQLTDGTFVAIKRAKKIIYDRQLGAEFENEVKTLSQIEHHNLVKCFGFLKHEDERIIVVEYVSNGNLREHLDCMHMEILSLASRLEIAIDVAHAITYLHTYTDHPIIHRDIKSSNILLTEKLRAKVADFGFARLAPDRNSSATHVSTQVKGTAGYLDPEYLMTYQLTDKSDVYSFGVLLVELMTGRRPIEAKKRKEERITAKWAMKKFMDGEALEVMDPNLEKNDANNFAMGKIFELALRCLGNNRRTRPNMQRCVEALWNLRKDYKEISSSIPQIREDEDDYNNNNNNKDYKA